jgi:hypothetical protein
MVIALLWPMLSTAMSDQVQKQRIKLSAIEFSDDHQISLK